MRDPSPSPPTYQSIAGEYQQPGTQPPPGGYQQPGTQPPPGGYQQPGTQQPPGGYQQPGTQASRYIFKPLSRQDPWSLSWPQHPANLYAIYYVDNIMYVRIIEPEDNARLSGASNRRLTWARVEGLVPRAHLLIVVTPLRHNMTKLPAFAIPPEDCGLSTEDIGKIETLTRPQLRTIRNQDQTRLPDIEYIAQDMSCYGTQNEVQRTADQWIFAWERGRRIVTTQSSWTSVWSNRNQGEDAILEYYESCGVRPPKAPRGLGERIRLQGLGVIAEQTSQPIQPPIQETVQRPVNTAQQPVNAAQQPVSTAQQPVNTAQQPVYTAQQPVYTAQQPYTAQQQPTSQDLISTIQSLMASLSPEQRQELFQAAFSQPTRITGVMDTAVPATTRLPSPPEEEL
jgi:hypothetical protein